MLEAVVVARVMEQVVLEALVEVVTVVQEVEERQAMEVLVLLIQALAVVVEHGMVLAD